MIIYNLSQVMTWLSLLDLKDDFSLEPEPIAFVYPTRSYKTTYDDTNRHDIKNIYVTRLYKK